MNINIYSKLLSALTILLCITSCSSQKSSESEILGYVDEPLVSIDFTHDAHSSVLDATQTHVIDKNLVHVTAWYDNEWGFSNRMCDTAVAMGKLI